MAATKALAFKVSKQPPELISPVETTPYEFKYLSDIDDQLRLHVPMISFYHRNSSMLGKDPVNVIRDAIAKALVFYYPLAGRLREYVAGKLAVECTGEGVLFVEANANVMLQDLGDIDTLYPPFPYLEDFLDIQGFDQITNSPLMFFQVTRLKCGGFILAYIFNHSMCDGAGIYQFMSAVAELARGAAAPSIPPVWQRHLLLTGHGAHREYDIVPESDTRDGTGATDIIVQQRSFLFSAADISGLRRTLPPHLQSCSKFEIVAGCVWRCRTIALSPKPDDEIVFLCVVDIRKRLNPPLPEGYYGNVIAISAAETSAEELCERPLGYAVELVRKAKDEATAANPTSVPARVKLSGTYLVSDLTHGGFQSVDVGWGTAAYGGVAKGVHGFPIPTNWYIPFKKKEEKESGTVVPLCLPMHLMEEFVKQLQIMITAGRMTSAL